MNAVRKFVKMLYQKLQKNLHLKQLILHGWMALNTTKVINDCKRIVHRWLASKLEPAGAKHVLRGLSNCKNNKGLWRWDE
ncbi:hypothetical protein RND71_012119 [Anisodus tanguticus]|uniref:Uncharacterized protein n=1 Tax=Anisodus tanguticus TaxID=243964 RepID=A0AAE1SF49_9SOLA|nr:hypothetical protein RND71_012119 [Anisodus tanguticus]